VGIQCKSPNNSEQKGKWDGCSSGHIELWEEMLCPVRIAKRIMRLHHCTICVIPAGSKGHLAKYQSIYDMPFFPSLLRKWGILV
jgi:hypothetical protein